MADIRRQGVDGVLNLGDSLSGPLLPRETARFLMDSDWLCLAGNHERQLLACAQAPGGLSDEYAFSQLGPAELQWVASLPPQHRFSPELFLCHGAPADDLCYLTETVGNGRMHLASVAEMSARLQGERSPVVACGHSHVQRSIRLPAGQLIVNPGSVGLQAYSDEAPAPHCMETGSPDARYAIVEWFGRAWSVQLHSVPYDVAPMVQLARRQGRPDWETALQHGRVH